MVAFSPLIQPYDPLSASNNRLMSAQRSPQSGGRAGGSGSNASIGRRMGGLFGRAMQGVRRFATPDNLQVIGHTLQEMGGQRGALDSYLAQRDERRAQTMQEKMAQQQRDALEAAIASMGPQQQALARANPTAFVAAVLRQQTSPDNGWESGQGYSHAFRVNPDGTVTLGDPLPLRPRAPIQGYVMPNDVDEWDYQE